MLTEGIKGVDVRDLWTIAVETRFGPVNCPGYIAGETRRFVREIGREPLNTPVESP